MLHVLLHMAESGEPITSEQLAVYMDTNAVVVRRTMSGLREAGLVRSEKGHGGGWTIARDLASITLGEVYAALGSPTLFAIGNRNENPNCLVEKAVNKALGDTLKEAEAMVVARLAGITLADIAADFRDRMSEFHDAMNRKTSHV
jgi:Rrf2 family protein